MTVTSFSVTLGIRFPCWNRPALSLIAAVLRLTPTHLRPRLAARVFARYPGFVVRHSKFTAV